MRRLANSHLFFWGVNMQRIDESRYRLLQAFMDCLGSYVEQEAKKNDVWRGQSYGQLYAHLKHELVEIQRSKDKTKQLHNCIDACTLAGLMVAKLLFQD